MNPSENTAKEPEVTSHDNWWWPRLLQDLDDAGFVVVRKPDIDTNHNFIENRDRIRRELEDRDSETS